MEKRIIVAFLISLVVVTGWQIIFPPPPPEEVVQESSDSTSKAPMSTPRAGDDKTPSAADSVDTATPLNPGAPRRAGEASSADADAPLIIADDFLHLSFSRRGGALRVGKLLTERQEVDSPEGVEGAFTFVYDYETGPKALALQDFNRREGWLDAVTWDCDGPSADGKSLVFSLPVEEQGLRYRITKTFRLSKGQPGRLGVELGFEHLAGEGTVQKSLHLATSGGVFPQKLVGAQISRPHGVAGILIGDELDVEQFDFDDIMEQGEGGKRVPKAIFACDMGLFFGAYLRYVEGGYSEGVEFQAVDPYSGDDPSDEELARYGPKRTYSFVNFGLQIGDRTPQQTVRFDYYLGPKDHRNIKRAFPEGAARDGFLAVANLELTSSGFCCGLGPLESVISLISKAVIAVLDLFYGFFGNMGVAIILLTLCVRTLMFPITRRSQTAMARHSKNMARVKPKLDALKEKYGNDRNVFAQKQMELMKAEKVQLVPVGGCLPMLLQIPIFFGLFSAIRFDYDLRHAPFLWCEDLSVPDRLIALSKPWVFDDCCLPMPISIDGLNIFPILMIGAMFVHQLGMPKAADPQMQQQQKMMMFMPIFFGFLMYGYAAGLSLYWLSSSLFGIFEQRVIKKIWPID
jgi:YidC/Oxa1 family membrane protein insertase